MSERVAIFPGSFDPFSKGHQNLVERALPLFDKIIIGIGINSGKESLLSAITRQKQIENLFNGVPKITVKIYDTLTVDFAREVNAKYILRGVRNEEDFLYEQKIAEANKLLSGIETIVFFADSDKKEISSSLIRELEKFGKNISDYLPEKR